MVPKSVFVLLWLLMSGSASASEVVRIGSAPRVAGTMDGLQAVVEAVNADRSDEIDAVEVETGGSLDNLRRLARGQIDAGTMSRHSLGYPSSSGPNSNGPDNLVALGIYSVSPQDVYVREDSGVRSLSDLEGKPFIAGGAGTGTERTSMAVFEALGIRPVWVRVAMDQIPAAVADGQAVGFVKSGLAFGPDRLVDEADDLVPLRAVPLPYGAMATLSQKVKGVVDWPSGNRTGPEITWADPLVVVCTRRLGDESAEAVARALVETDLVEEGFDRRTEALSLDFDLHPAAARYLSGPLTAEDRRIGTP